MVNPQAAFLESTVLPASLALQVMAQGSRDRGGASEDPGSDRATAGHDELPYKVELWNEERTAVERCCRRVG